MKALFGVPMDTIMYVLLGCLAVALASVAYIFFRNRMMFNMGLRNLPRRGLQTVLVVAGLMLATLITTAAFTTGDTVDFSIKRGGYEALQRSDLALNFVGEDVNINSDVAVYVNESIVPAMEREFAQDPDIDGFLPYLFEPVPAVNQRTQLSEPRVMLSGIDPARLGELGGLRLTGGGKADLTSLGANDIFLSKKAADALDAREGDTLTIYANGESAILSVKGIVKDEIASAGVGDIFGSGGGGGAMLLSSVQRLTGHTGEVNAITVALKGSVSSSYKNSDAAAERLQPYLQTDQARQLLGISNPVTVETAKQDAIEEAELIGNFFTTFFLIIGLFSIAAGVMLIFMIFVMLATERKAEMGMARAVGAQRNSLTQAFIAEGMAYSLLAGAAGAIFGVLASLGLVVGVLKLSGGFDFIQAHVTVRSLVVSYCLGVVVTFITVVISSLRVSAVNIVAAIRGSEEEPQKRVRSKIRWLWVALGIPTLVIPPLGIWILFRKGFGVSWTWILAPLGIILGLGSIFLSKDGGSGSLFLFSFGVSVLPLSVAAIASYYRANGRVTWTLVGIYLAAYWLAPIDYGKVLLGTELAGDIEMFLLSGIMIVVSASLIIVFNAQLMTMFFQSGSKYPYGLSFGLAALAAAFVVVGVILDQSGSSLGQLLYLFGAIIFAAAVLAFIAVRVPSTAPALKMGVAYPLSNRFRTGMTIAMFSLIIFSLAVFSSINQSFVSMLTAEGGDGGWDVMVTSSRNAERTDLLTDLANVTAPVANDIETAGSTTLFTGASEARLAGSNDDYKPFPVLAADKAFFDMTDGKLNSWAEGYDNERAVFNAVAGSTQYALVDPSLLPEGFNNYDFNNPDLEVDDKRFEPFQIEYRDLNNPGQVATVTVIGVLAIQVDATYTAGVYVSDAAYRQTFGEPDYLRTYVKLNSGVNAKQAALDIEAALITTGAQSESIRKLLDDTVAQQSAFFRMFQGFMALGLLTGIAALGVIAFRSVVERRQQIGMLRAIGYQTGTVALTFVLESGFIATMGILSGVVGGMIISHNLMTGGEFGSGIEFTIPWVELILITGAAFIFSLLMTWLPAKQAAKVPVAEALRYE